jgi:pyruvate,water dikinase
MQIEKTPSLDNFGGKGYNLYLLSKFAPVPEFFVISCGDDSLDEKEIFAEFEKLGAERVSVRSSATIEDGKTASFAGMFDSLLNITRDNLICAIKEIASSYKNERVKKYCEIKNIDFSKCKMRIVIQKMVASRISGVCITKPSEVLIEAVYGLGEGLVSGEVTPDTYFIDRDNSEIKSQNISSQKKMLVNQEYDKVPFFMANAKKMQDNEIQELSKIALNIEENLNFSMADIEWAYEGDKLYILQAREYVEIV